MTLPADLNALLIDLRPAAERAVVLQARRRRRAIALTALTVALVSTGAALAAVALLGGPAPKSVEQSIHRSAASFVGHPELVKQSARVLAEAPDATLYGVKDKQGNYCVELIGATKGLTVAWSCGDAYRVGSHYVTGGDPGSSISSVVIGDAEPPVVRFGRLATGTVAARALYPDGSSEPIQIGLGGFFVYEPSPAKQLLARRAPLTIQFLDRAGHPSLSNEIQPPQPLRSQGANFNRISGHVLITGATTVEIDTHPPLPSRTTSTTFLPIHKDGSFVWTHPANNKIFDVVVTVLDAHRQPLTEMTGTIRETIARQMYADARRHP